MSQIAPSHLTTSSNMTTSKKSTLFNNSNQLFIASAVFGVLALITPFIFTEEALIGCIACVIMQFGIGISGLYYRKKEKATVGAEEDKLLTAEEHDNNYTATYTTEAENTARQLGERAAEYREGIAFSRVSGVSSYRMYMNVGTSGGTPAEISWFRPGVPVSTQPPQEEVIEEKQVEQTQKVIEHMINNTDDRDIDI